MSPAIISVWLSLSWTIVSAHDGRDKLDRSTKLLEDDRGVQRLCDDDWNFAARQELRFFTGISQQMRLRQDLSEVVVLEILEVPLQLVVTVAGRQAISQTLRQQHSGKGSARLQARVDLAHHTAGRGDA